MPLTPDEAVAQARDLLAMRDTERVRLERIHSYLRDDPDRRLSGLPEGAPAELHRLARLSRVNFLKFIVNTRLQAMFVDGFRVAREADDVPAWEIWQRNRFDARQIGVHRAALAYGAAYVTVLPGDPAPVLRGASPRRMTVAYGDDDEWPAFALEHRRGGWRLFDDEAVYWLSGDNGDDLKLESFAGHGAASDGRPVTPVVRFRETDDLDDEVLGIVEPFICLQDQVNITTFGLQVAQHYGAFRQRYVIGWLAENEETKLKASASKLWTFEDSPDEIKIGEFSQVDLKGYIDSREATLKHLATVSATPAHELLGELVNLSADALASAEKAHRAAVHENQTSLGEAWEQVLGLAGEMMGVETDPKAYVRWKDTESRSLAQTADALGKLTQMLGVPPQELWERVPGVSQQEIERWKAAAADGDAFAQMTQLLQRQATAEPAGAAA